MFVSGQLRVRAYQSYKTTVQDCRLFFRQTVLAHNLSGYLSRKIGCKTEYYFMDFDQPPLSTILQNWRGNLKTYKRDRNFRRIRKRIWPCMVECLLKHDNSLNEPIIDDSSGRTTTPWVDFIGDALSIPIFAARGTFASLLNAEVFSVLLNRGADPNAYVEGYWNALGCDKAPFWINWLLQVFQMPDLWRFRDRYLRDLGTVFELGVDFKLMNSLLQRSGDGLRSPWALFCEQLEILASRNITPNAIDVRQLELIAQVLVDLAKAAGDDLTAWDVMVPSLRRLFPPVELRRMFEAMGIKADQNIMRSRGRYRRPVMEVSSSCDTQNAEDGGG